jgi:DNA-binding MarR family transcriptional regulator
MSKKTDGEDLLHALSAAWTAVDRQVSSALSHTRGISLSEYRILRTLSLAPQQRASRVDLARSVGLTPSAVTRALGPLERIGMVATEKNERDARLALAVLTSAGADVVSDATAVIRDVMTDLVSKAPLAGTKDVAAALAQLGGG